MLRRKDLLQKSLGKIASARKNLFQKDLRDITGKDITDFLTGTVLRDWFTKKNIPISEEQVEGLVRKINEIQNYQPRIAIFGKTGSGKSSLCNAIFDEDVALVSDTEACTREPQEYLLTFHAKKSLVLLDVPGVGESQARDQEYEALYASLLPQVDLLLWVVKSDDRALSVDERVWNNSVREFITAGCPVFLVITQADKLNPLHEWNRRRRCPGPAQQKLIAEKVEALSRAFGVPPEQIIPVSAAEKYNVARLVEAIVFALPNEKKLPFYNAVTEEAASPKAEEAARKGFFAAMMDFLATSFEEIEPYIPTIMRLLRLVAASLLA